MSTYSKKSIYILLSVVAFFAVTGVFVYLFGSSLPAEGSVRLSRNEALQHATLFLEAQQGRDLVLKNNPVLTFDLYGSLFIEENIGDRQEAYYTQFGLPRFVYEYKFSSKTGDEYSVSVDASTGNIVAWNSDVTQSFAQNNVSMDTSQKTIIPYLKERGFSSSSLSLLSQGTEMTETKSGGSVAVVRTVYIQEGSEIDSAFGKGYVTYAVRSMGDAVIGYAQAFSVPQPYTQNALQKQSSDTYFDFFLSLLYFCMFCVAVYIVYRHRSRFRTIYRIPLILTSCIGIVSILETVNGIPALGRLFAEMGTSLSLFVYLGVSLATYALPFFVFLVAGIILYEKAKLQGSVFFPNGTTPSQITKGIVVGYMAGGAILCVLLLTMFIENGGTTNNSLKDFDYLIATYYPSFSIFSIVSSIPAFVEEVTFRLFASLFIMQISRSRMVGAVTATVVWIIPHVALGNAIDPLEILYFTFFGIVLMYMFLRHGIIFAILSHFVVNATLGIVLLAYVFSLTKEVVWSGVLMLALPAIIGVCGIVYKERFKLEATRHRTVTQ